MGIKKIDLLKRYNPTGFKTEKELLVNLYTVEEKTLAEIAELTGVRLNVIAKRIKSYGIPIIERSKRKKSIEAIFDEIPNSQLFDMTRTELAEMLDCTPANVSRVLKKKGKTCKNLRKNSMQAEPPPVKNEYPAIWDLVIEDMKNRDEFGLHKYGMRLQPFNGRDALQDAYQEALDLCVYLKQAMLERGKK